MGTPGERIHFWVFASPAILSAVLCLAFWQPFRANDDLLYARAAMQWQPHAAAPIGQVPDHRDARLGAVAPLAGIFWLAGPSETTLTLLPMACTVLAAAVVAWLAARMFGSPTGLVAGVLYALLPLSVTLSPFYAPEPLLALELTVAAVLFLRALESATAKPGLRIATGMLVGLAYLTTEVGALMLPVFYLHLLLDRRWRPADALFAVGFAVVLAGELAFNAVVHEGALWRYAMTHGYTADPMVVDANQNLVERLFKAYPRQFVYPNTSFGLYGVPLLAAGIAGVARFRTRKLLVIWAVVILAFYNFMSGSLTHYVALPVATRLLLPACVPLVILAAVMVTDVWAWAGNRTSRVATRVLLVAAGGGVAAVSLLSMYLMTAPDLTGMIARNASAAAHAMPRDRGVVVITDPTTAQAIQFYRTYNPSDQYTSFAEARELDTTSAAATRSSFVVLNGAVINERTIFGNEYGDGLSLTQSDRAALLAFQPSADAVVAQHRPPVGAAFPGLLEFAWARSLLGSFRVGFTEAVLASNGAIVEVIVYRRDRSSRG